MVTFSNTTEMATKPFTLFAAPIGMEIFLRSLNSIVALVRGFYVFQKGCMGKVCLLSLSFAKISELFHNIPKGMNG